MAQPKQAITPHDVFQLLVRYRWRWGLPALAGGVLALVYACLSPDKWEASQALVIRNEAQNTLDMGGAGKFRHTDDMKVVQETLLEIARSRQVLNQALTAVNKQEANGKEVAAPTDKAIETLRKRIKLTPPKGAEFGKTEVFYLKVSDPNRQRAVELATAICDAMQASYQHVLNEKAGSMVSELTDSVEQAQINLKQASTELETMEREVGNDLVELRILHSSPAGASDLRQRVVAIESEIRRLKTVARNDQELQTLLKAAQVDAKQLISAPATLLESQPALKRLKDGLIDAQLKTAQLEGNMTADHPNVRSANTAEEAIRHSIHEELALALQSVEADMRLIAAQVQLQENRLNETNAQLTKIAGLRTRYANLVSQVESATKQVQTTENALADARAKQLGSQHASLLNRIDSPDAGTKPISPPKLAVAASGFFAGLIAGIGLVVLTVPMSHPTPTTSTTKRNRKRVEAETEPNFEQRIAAGLTKPEAPQWNSEPIVEPVAAAAERTTQRNPRTTAPGEKLNLKQALLHVTGGDSSKKS